MIHGELSEPESVVIAVVHPSLQRKAEKRSAQKYAGKLKKRSKQMPGSGKVKKGLGGDVDEAR